MNSSRFIISLPYSFSFCSCFVVYIYNNSLEILFIYMSFGFMHKFLHHRMVVHAGCDHEFCTQCALYLCSTNSTSSTTSSPPGSIACPLCRHGIVSFVKLPDARPLQKEIQRPSNLSLAFCTCSSEVLEDSTDMTTPFCKPTSRGSKTSSVARKYRSKSCQAIPSFKINPSLCLGAEVSPSLVPCTASRTVRSRLARCSSLRRSSSQTERRKSWFCSFNQSVATGSGCWLHFGLFIKLFLCVTPT